LTKIQLIYFGVSVSESCHKKTRATKKYSIRKAPNILVVHLKRFDFSVMGKLSHHVAYPELLNLKNLTQSPVSLDSLNGESKKDLKSLTYKLYGVLVHLGHTSRSGHYYSYVKGPNEAWFRADDSRVRFFYSLSFTRG
jgi:ubiquitin carboxyl-terminal hydrolase 36/42